MAAADWLQVLAAAALLVAGLRHELGVVTAWNIEHCGRLLYTHRSPLLLCAACLLGLHVLLKWHGRARRSGSGALALVDKPGLDYRHKEVADPSKKGWGYAGVRSACFVLSSVLCDHRLAVSQREGREGQV